MQSNKPKQSILDRTSQIFSLEVLQAKLGEANALPLLSILSVITGVITSLIIILFLLVIDFVTRLFMPSSENFESLTRLHAFCLPIFGSLIIGIILTVSNKRNQKMGIVHVMQHLAKSDSKLPLSNAITQFFLGALGLITGLSGGREGPAVHLGATSASFLGHTLRLPHNTSRILISGGVAAAVAASFNTPIAGVIFAMEVVMMEYTVLSFLPVILASATSTVVLRLVLGDLNYFNVPYIELISLPELSYIAIMGVVIGFISFLFIHLTQQFSKFENRSIFSRAILVGIVMALTGFIFPAALGIGYDTVNLLLIGEFTLGWLISFVIVKSIVSAMCVGLGMPVGIIGPTLVIGASIGSIIGLLSGFLSGDNSPEIALYVIVGMASMMAAVLQAPLAALLAVVELTGSLNVIVPAMLSLVIATFIVSLVFKKKSIFVMRLSDQGLNYPPNPLSQHLLKSAISSVMQNQFLVVDGGFTVSETKSYLKNIEPIPNDTLVIFDRGEVHESLIFDSSKLLKLLDQQFLDNNLLISTIAEQGPATKNIDVRSTLLFGTTLFQHGDVDYLCVRSYKRNGLSEIKGVVTKECINQFMAKYTWPNR